MYTTDVLLYPLLHIINTTLRFLQILFSYRFLPSLLPHLEANLAFTPSHKPINLDALLIGSYPISLRLSMLVPTFVLPSF